MLSLWDHRLRGRLPRQGLRLPRTSIETDSYIAVQLIEHKKALNPDSLRYMAEQVEGSFTFTVLDGRDNLYFVKGGNPLCLVHFPKTGLYLSPLQRRSWAEHCANSVSPLEKPVRVEASSGDILRIDRSGTITQSRFDTDHLIQAWYCSMYTPAFSRCRIPAKASSSLAEAADVDELKSVAGALGYALDMIDQLLKEGCPYEHQHRQYGLHHGGQPELFQGGPAG